MAGKMHDNIRLYHVDHLGSTALVTDIDGEITQHVAYIPYGEIFVEQRNGSWSTPYLFNAKELDEETGLYYYGARYLDPKDTRWLSVDPMFEKFTGVSPYAYCHNNPISRQDPTGKDDYEFNSEGYVIRQIYNKNRTRFFMVENGERKKELSFDKNVILSHKQEKGISTHHGKTNDVNIDMFHISDERSAKKIFEFLAINTNVEWGKMTFGNKYHQEGIITTSHEYASEAGIKTLINSRKYDKYEMTDFTHSHTSPRCTYPSGLKKNEVGSDIIFAKKLTKRFGNSVTFRIYNAHLSEPYYLSFFPNSTYYDYFDENGDRLFK